MVRRSEHIHARDEAIWHLLDSEGPCTATQIARSVGISRTLAHGGLNRLEVEGRVRRINPDTMPLLWEIVGTTTDAVAMVELTVRDARFVIHMLTAMLREGRAGEPTEQLIERIEAATEAADYGGSVHVGVPTTISDVSPTSVS